MESAVENLEELFFDGNSEDNARYMLSWTMFSAINGTNTQIHIDYSD